MDQAQPLSDDALVPRRGDRPVSGWRRAVLDLTGGSVDLGPGPADRRRSEQLARTRTPLLAPHRVAIGSIKGGVGKTTVTACLGLVLAECRGDRVIALDANPDAGTLADRLVGGDAGTVGELLRDVHRVASWSELAQYTSLVGRLHVLASEQDPAAGDAFSWAEYADVTALLARYFDILLTDSGTGLVHSAMQGTLATADSIVVVGAPTVDGASRAAKTLDWLAAHGYERLARNAVVVLSCDRGSHEVDRDAVRAHFRARTRAIVEIPHDRHLAVGGRVELARLERSTREAVLELAAHVVDGFPRLTEPPASVAPPPAATRQAALRPAAPRPAAGRSSAPGLLAGRVGSPDRPVRLGTVAHPAVVPLLRGLARRTTPSVHAVITQERPAVLLQAVRRGDLDLALSHDHPYSPADPVPGLEQRTVVAAEPMFVAVGPRHPLADREAVSAAEAAELPWADAPVDRVHPSTTAAFWEAVGRTPAVTHRFVDARSAVDVLTGNDVMAMAVATSVDERLRYVRLDHPLAFRRLFLLWRPDRLPVDVVDVVARELADRMRALLPRLPHLRRWLEAHPAVEPERTPTT